MTKAKQIASTHKGQMMTSELIVDSANDHWELTTLGEACRRGGGDIQTGPFGSQLHASDYVSSGIPSIMPQNLTEDRISIEGIARILPIDAERLSRYRVRAGDIVYSRRGDVERRALVTPNEDGWLCGTGCLRIRLGEGVTDPRFAFYWLGHASVREWIVRHAIGATLPNLNTSILSAVPFLLPPLPEQRTIAAILGSLDDKIELNRRMNATLEATARALYKSWFVDFDPVRAKMECRQPDGMDANTAALFPDRLVETELGLIPEGWRVGCLGEIAANPRRSVQPQSLSSGTLYIGLEHMPQRSISLADWGMATDVESNKYQFFQGELLFGKLRPYFHKVGIAPVDGICSTDILVVSPTDDDWWGFVLMVISDTAFIDHATLVSGGTRMPRVTWQDMARYEIVIPETGAARAFNEFVHQMAHLLTENIHQSRTLAATRDALLPKLLSGEVQVDTAEFTERMNDDDTISWEATTG